MLELFFKQYFESEFFKCGTQKCPLLQETHCVLKALDSSIYQSLIKISTNFLLDSKKSTVLK